MTSDLLLELQQNENDLIELSQNADKQNKCQKAFGHAKNISLIKYKTGLFYEGNYYFTPTWTVLISNLFFVGLFTYFGFLAKELFEQIINVNTYRMKKDIYLIGNATIPQSIDLFPWGLRSDLTCDDVQLFFDVVDMNSYATVPEITNL